MSPDCIHLLNLSKKQNFACLTLSLLCSFINRNVHLRTLRTVGHEPFSLFCTDWVDVANDLLSKCHINLRLRKLTDCDANVFISLYENILGEKVPGKRKQTGDCTKVMHLIPAVYIFCLHAVLLFDLFTYLLCISMLCCCCCCIHFIYKWIFTMMNCLMYKMTPPPKKKDNVLY